MNVFSVKVVLNHGKVRLDGGFLLACIGYNCYFIGYAGVAVVGAMLRWKRLGSIKTYISGDITDPAYSFTGDWGHGIFFSALAK
jgi:hypothetical protein